MNKLSNQEIVRRKKLQKLKENNINPFGQKFIVSHNVASIIAKYQSKTREALEEITTKKKEQVTLAGRVITKRAQGKTGFCHIQDASGKIQLYVRLDAITQQIFENIWQPMDLGDIIGVAGLVMKTKKGELSIKVNKLTHLSKALKPLPNNYYGLKDIEEKIYKRYLDLIVSKKASYIAFTRPKIIRSLQKYLDNNGFVEVETPMLHSFLGGALAKPFKTYHNTLNMPFYLRVAPELALKKLLVGGMEKVYEIGRSFRNEGISKIHNPEFSSLEVYQAYGDYQDMMKLTEKLFNFIDQEVFDNQKIYHYEGKTIDLTPPFTRVHIVDAIKKETNLDFWKDISFLMAKKWALKHGIEVLKHWKTGHIINAFFEKFVEPTLIHPTFVYGHPIDVSPLAQANENDPRFANRFEFFIGGREYANAFTELNDPLEQLKRFQQQIKEKNLGNQEACEIDVTYIEALEYGMPPAGGLGIGIDRMMMFFLNASSIREVILFPANRHKNKLKI